MGRALTERERQSSLGYRAHVIMASSVSPSENGVPLSPYEKVPKIEQLLLSWHEAPLHHVCAPGTVHDMKHSFIMCVRPELEQNAFTT